MTHADADALALLALEGAPLPEDVSAHVDTCPTCAAELAALTRVVESTRSAARTVLTRPDPRVWAAIRDAVGTREISAHAALLPLRAALVTASGEAEVSTDDQGRRMLQVTLRAELPAHGLRQAWLVDRDEPDRRQTLGIMDGTAGLWSVDRSIDLHQFAVVEITQQDIGSTQHSGQVVTRGGLVFAAA